MAANIKPAAELLDAKNTTAISPPVWRHAHPSQNRNALAAEIILSDLQKWANKQPFERETKVALINALHEVLDLLTTGTTEVDESLAALGRGLRSMRDGDQGEAETAVNVARKYLNRWQGRGGRVGNAGRGVALIVDGAHVKRVAMLESGGEEDQP